MLDTPNLTNFPTTTLATAERKKQAQIRQHREQMLAYNSSDLAAMFADIIPPEFLSEIDETKRQRHYGNIPIFWSWLTQIFHQNSSCSHGLSLIQSWAHCHNTPAPTGDTSAYCKARKRLPLPFLQSVLKRINTKLDSMMLDNGLWHGHRVKSIDGTSFKLMDTSENQSKFPQHPSQKPGCGTPTMGSVGLLNMVHGGWEKFSMDEWSVHDAKAANKFIEDMEQNDILLADRGFCSFELIARLMTERKCHVLIRLHQAREKNLDWSKGEKINENERLVTWEKPKKKPSGSSLSKQDWQALPDQIQLRMVRKEYKDRYGETKEMIVVTDLLDTKKYKACSILDLYYQRWQIEVKFRDIKSTLGMEFLNVKTPEMIEKSMYLVMIAYNLLRYLMNVSAHRAGLHPNLISFKGVLDCVISNSSSFMGLNGKPKKKRKWFNLLVEDIATKLLNIRPGRSEPRAVKRRPKTYQLLTKPRAVFKEQAHRGRKRKTA